MKNRLQLNWALSTSKERTDFLQSYITSDIFEKRPPTEDELETMANYLLWGQDSDGLNSDQKKEIQLPRRNSTWSAQNIESLDELMESPTFSENSIYDLYSTLPKKNREVFSREEIRKKASSLQLEPFETLWKEIDQTELITNFFEIEKGKREKPPRNELLQRFSEQEIEYLKNRAKKLNQFTYLKMRHLLVELRREQYTLRDSILPRHVSFSKTPPHQFSDESSELFFPILPLGSFNKLFFQDFDKLIPGFFSEKELSFISRTYWEKKKEEKSIQNEKKSYFDFRNLEMVYQLFLDLESLSEVNKDLLDTFWYYVKQANLSEIHQKILQLKISKRKNQEIAEIVNKEFNKNYTVNYISTIFRQKIIPAINTAAIYHEKVIGSIFFEEDFKVCSKCGKTLLRDPENFVRRSRAKDGLSNHCKKCDKEERDKKKRGI